MNIFGRNGQGVDVPEIDVHGDNIRVQGTEAVEEQQREPQPRDREYKLPKTKWFSDEEMGWRPCGCHL